MEQGGVKTEWIPAQSESHRCHTSSAISALSRLGPRLKVRVSLITDFKPLVMLYQVHLFQCLVPCDHAVPMQGVPKVPTDVKKFLEMTRETEVIRSLGIKPPQPPPPTPPVFPLNPFRVTLLDLEITVYNLIIYTDPESI